MTPQTKVESNISTPTFVSLYDAAATLPIPPRITKELRSHPVSGDHRALPVGSPGKVGFLYARVDSTGDKHAGHRSVVAEKIVKAPLALMRPLYTDPHQPGTPLLYVMTTGAGLAHNDRHLVDIRVGEAKPASALITTQAATPIYRMDVGLAIQHVNLTVGPGSTLEYMPDHVIPYEGSRAHLSMRVTAARGGCAIVSDCIAAGRLGRGEWHRYDALSMETRIDQPRADHPHDCRRLGESGYRPLVIDRGLLRPHSGSRLLGMRNYGAWSNVWIVVPSPQATQALLDVLRRLPNSDFPASVRWATSTLPYESGVWVRIFAATADEARIARDRLWTAARETLLSAPAPRLRKY
ncbi:urease accessory protein UreD [Corynebacterium pseudokroppenstedtii]|uniref:Urease accessory protein UreD n=2 Tax=Corynebacterium pseudokroppenstedtii TaxID=2804917 RepID=A0AAU0Q2M9_9CORY|nr:urease accessory protein UreD [Corynebacterium pseudokroppenstedtii]MDU7503665.1 urease accessory protein UreD [Corynebacterium kroppenstedtii]MBY0790990.1 urease accessory protein UreD [Corynebacterium pseudokroppenstedtii]MCF6792804.1 urease accessory protein UreD [Corynebacterium pseudokroppenstedtii]MCF8702746.1 urease accessory protein UreD [Corynebacterium pseudokroppenstedtii]MCG2636260.1 urease accessory protein UreD [Corynebacterium pseudokroppenstedtii]